VAGLTAAGTDLDSPPGPPHLSYKESRKRSAEGVRRYWAVEGPKREAPRAAAVTAAANEIGPLSDREFRIAGAIAYWCEGAKGKPWRRGDTIAFRHNPSTVRKNVGDGYHGCLVVGVLRGAELYQKIEGWALGAMGGSRVPC
jgi:hypothetical protein